MIFFFYLPTSQHFFTTCNSATITNVVLQILEFACRGRERRAFSAKYNTKSIDTFFFLLILVSLRELSFFLSPHFIIIGDERKIAGYEH